MLSVNKKLAGLSSDNWLQSGNQTTQRACLDPDSRQWRRGQSQGRRLHRAKLLLRRETEGGGRQRERTTKRERERARGRETERGIR